MKTFKISFIIAVLLFITAITATVASQVTIGADNAPQPFSVLELISSGERGLRLPQLSDTDKTAAFGADNAVLTAAGTAAMGLTIFNTSIRCVETWNGVAWIQQCPPSGPYVPPVVVIPDGKGGDDWATTKWVGAFWKDNQTGERIIASKGVSGQPWSAVVDDPSGAGSWLVLEANGGTDPALWTDAPHDAENYQVSGNATTVNGTGDILFRIGAKTVNPNTDGTYNTGKAPRYATITLTVNGVNFKLFCRQGESADYVFRKTDAVSGGTVTDRSLAAKFSPYTLTASALADNSPDLGVQVAVRGGVFANYPTQAGALWQWGTDKSNTATYNNFLRHAYHPVKPATAISGWDSDYTYPASGDTWNEFTGADRLETCPNGWRRPMVGDTTTLHSAQLASGSEMMQSLFSTTFDGSNSNTNSSNYRYWGYYADGFFDRRPIVNATGTSAINNSAVSVSTKDVAYIGMLFTNPATNASLFAPAGGYRSTSGGSLYYAGNTGYYWSSSAYDASTSWRLSVLSSNAYQGFTSRTIGFALRCVSEL